MEVEGAPTRSVETCPQCEGRGWLPAEGQSPEHGSIECDCVERGEIPEADHRESWNEKMDSEWVDLVCPEGCGWEMPYSWYEMENRRPDEYVAHYQAEHSDGPGGGSADAVDATGPPPA